MNLILNGSSDATTIKTIKNGTPKMNDYQIEKMDCNEDNQMTEYNIMSTDNVNGHHQNHLLDADYSSNGYHNGHNCDELSNGTSRVNNNGNEESMGLFNNFYSIKTLLYVLTYGFIKIQILINQNITKLPKKYVVAASLALKKC